MDRVLSYSGVGVGHVARRQQKIQILRCSNFETQSLRFTLRVARALRVGHIVSCRFREPHSTHARRLSKSNVLMSSLTQRSAHITSLCLDSEPS